MGDVGYENIEIQESHPPGKARQWAWLAVSDGYALGIFVVYQPSPAVEVAFDRAMYVVERARDRGVATCLARHARRVLADGQPSIVLMYSGIATAPGQAVAMRAGIEMSEKRADVLKKLAIQYENFNQAKADEEGYEALCAAAARLHLRLPES